MMNPALESTPVFPTGIVPQATEEPTLANACALLDACLVQLHSACKIVPDAATLTRLAFSIEHAATDAVTTLMEIAEAKEVN